jgi:hypothetical protein
MSGPDGIDERFGTLVDELRSGEATASPELRERVRAIATREPEPPGARFRARLPRRRFALVLVPVCALAAAAVGFGVLGSSGGGNRRAADEAAGTKQARLHKSPAPLPATGFFAPGTTSASSGSSAAPAPSGSRAQIYSADLRLRVSDLSGTTKQAITLTRGWGGYVVTVDYGSGRKSGDAYLVVRIPVVRVQAAIARLTALGTILDDHVSIQDIQGQLNRRFSQMADLRAQIATLRAKLADTSLTTSQRAFLEASLATRQARLVRLEEAQTAQKTRAGFATVALELQTKKAAAVVPSKPGRIGQALHNIGRVLVTEAEILLYVLLIAAPFVVLAVLLWVSRRSLRRRSDDQLLMR